MALLPGSGRAPLVIALREGKSIHIRGPFNASKIVVDPEDRGGFVSAIRDVAPHVAIDPALVQ
jgi:hypothetical protein